MIFSSHTCNFSEMYLKLSVELIFFPDGRKALVFFNSVNLIILVTLGLFLLVLTPWRQLSSGLGFHHVRRPQGGTPGPEHVSSLDLSVGPLISEDIDRTVLSYWP